MTCLVSWLEGLMTRLHGLCKACCPGSTILNHSASISLTPSMKQLPSVKKLRNHAGNEWFGHSTGHGISCFLVNYYNGEVLPYLWDILIKNYLYGY